MACVVTIAMACARVCRAGAAMACACCAVPCAEGRAGQPLVTPGDTSLHVGRGLGSCRVTRSEHPRRATDQDVSAARPGWPARSSPFDDLSRPYEWSSVLREARNSVAATRFSYEHHEESPDLEEGRGEVQYGSSGPRPEQGPNGDDLYLRQVTARPSPRPPMWTGTRCYSVKFIFQSGPPYFFCK